MICSPGCGHLHPFFFVRRIPPLFNVLCFTFSRACDGFGKGSTSWTGLRVPMILAITLSLVLLPGCSTSNLASEETAPIEDPAPAPDGFDPGNGDSGTGMGFQPQSEAVPVFDPSKPLVIERGNADRKMVALTIDDGWSKDDRILDLLEYYGIRCTVFPIGGRGVAEADPAWIKRMDDDGFEVCTHTYSHYKLTDHPEEWISEEIFKGREVIASITGKRYPYMRPPGGFVNNAVKAAAAANGCYIVLWSNEFGDASQNITVDGEVSAVLSRLSNGDIILCHFGGRNTYEALQRLIPEIQSRGYRFVTLTELLGLQ